MDVRANLPADAQAAEGAQQGEGLLHDVAVFAQAGAVFGAAAGDQRADLQLAHQTPEAFHSARRRQQVMPEP